MPRPISIVDATRALRAGMLTPLNLLDQCLGALGTQTGGSLVRPSTYWSCHPLTPRPRRARHYRFTTLSVAVEPRPTACRQYSLRGWA